MPILTSACYQQTSVIRDFHFFYTVFISQDYNLVMCGVTRYNAFMIKGFRHKGIKKFFETGSKKGIQPGHAEKLSRQLTVLNEADKVDDMDFPGWDLHPLKGNLKDHWSISVNGNWRMTFMFDNGDAWLVDYQDYH